MPFQVSSAWKTTTTTTTAILYYVCITACNFGLWNDRIPSTTSLSHHVISSYLIARVCRRDYNETILRPGLNRETFHWEEGRQGKVDGHPVGPSFLHIGFESNLRVYGSSFVPREKKGRAITILSASLCSWTINLNTSRGTRL